MLSWSCCCCLLPFNLAIRDLHKRPQATDVWIIISTFSVYPLWTIFHSKFPSLILQHAHQIALLDLSHFHVLDPLDVQLPSCISLPCFVCPPDWFAWHAILALAEGNHISLLTTSFGCTSIFLLFADLYISSKKWLCLPNVCTMTNSNMKNWGAVSYDHFSLG